MTIYILEIPHQRAASCWSRNTREQVLKVIQQQAIRSGESIDDYDTAVEWLGSDLSALRVYDDAEEALAGLGYYQGHQSGAAYAALGIQGRARAATGGALVLCYRDERDGHLIHIRASRVGENGIEPDTWYTLDAKCEFVAIKTENEAGNEK